MTRGTTPGVSKRIPTTQTDLDIRVAAAQGLLNYLLRTGQLEAIDGYSLNLNYPLVLPKRRNQEFQAGNQTWKGQASPHWQRGMLSNRTGYSILPSVADAMGGTHDNVRRSRNLKKS